MDSLIYAARPLITDFLGSIFFVVLLAFKVDVSVAAAIGIAVSIAVIVVPLLRRRAVAALQWASLALVLLSAAASMLTHDPQFVMAKPTLIYVAVGFVMLQPGWMKRYIPPIAVGHIDRVTDIFGYVWSALMFITAAANLIIAVWFTPYWIVFLGTFPVASKVALFAIQYWTSRTIARRRILAQRAALVGRPAPA